MTLILLYVDIFFFGFGVRGSETTARVAIPIPIPDACTPRTSTLISPTDILSHPTPSHPTPIPAHPISSLYYSRTQHNTTRYIFIFLRILPLLPNTPTSTSTFVRRLSPYVYIPTQILSLIRILHLVVDLRRQALLGNTFHACAKAKFCPHPMI